MTPPNIRASSPSAWRRVAGIVVDWTLCLVISSAFFPDGNVDQEAVTGVERVLWSGQPMAALGVWALQHVFLVATIGTTIGHRLLGLKVIHVAGAPFVGVTKALIRTVVLALVIPAVVWDEEGRGLHDRAAGTRLVLIRDGLGE